MTFCSPLFTLVDRRSLPLPSSLAFSPSHPTTPTLASPTIVLLFLLRSLRFPPTLLFFSFFLYKRLFFFPSFSLQTQQPRLAPRQRHLPKDLSQIPARILLRRQFTTAIRARIPVPRLVSFAFFFFSFFLSFSLFHFFRLLFFLFLLLLPFFFSQFLGPSCCPSFALFLSPRESPFAPIRLALSVLKSSLFSPIFFHSLFLGLLHSLLLTRGNGKRRAKREREREREKRRDPAPRRRPVTVQSIHQHIHTLNHRHLFSRPSRLPQSLPPWRQA